MFEIPTIAVPVTLTLTNDERIPGNFFVTCDRISAGGNPAIEDILNNGRDLFVSFQSDVGAFRLINKRHIIFIETQQTDQEIRSLTPHEPQSLVLHFSRAHTLFGIIYPTEQAYTRVSDLLNQPSQFLALYRQGTKFIFNRDTVIYANAG
jgi:hypothetical protein